MRSAKKFKKDFNKKYTNIKLNLIANNKIIYLNL